MIHYSHKMAPTLEASFLKGFQLAGIERSLWKRRAKLLDLVQLLQLIHANLSKRRPIMNSDVVDVDHYTVKHWSMF